MHEYLLPHPPCAQCRQKHAGNGLITGTGRFLACRSLLTLPSRKALSRWRSRLATAHSCGGSYGLELASGRSSRIPIYPAGIGCTEPVPRILPSSPGATQGNKRPYFRFTFGRLDGWPTGQGLWRRNLDYARHWEVSHVRPLCLCLRPVGANKRVSTHVQ